jgi:23S rRNA (adenine2503-C2)-methyltransferase
MTTRYGLSRDGIEAMLAAWGEPRYRAAQVHDGLYAQRRPLGEVTNVPKDLRARLDGALPLAFEAAAVQHGDAGTTTKWLWRARDAAEVETVLMRYRDRATVCVSSQAGCAMACTFCATGQAGFARHLDPGEILEQVLRAQHASPQRVTNVVFMGMGEPLANVDAVLDACDRLHAEVGLSARHMIDAVLAAARDYADRKGRRVTFEYAGIDGVNDRPDQADALAARLVGFRGGAHVNLIPLNPTAGFGGRASPRPRLQAFAERLRARGVGATVRRNRGVDIDAACGQLRSRGATGPTGFAKSARMAP